MNRFRASRLLCTVAVSLALGAAIAAPPMATSAQEGDAAIARLMQDWQNRILAERLPVSDPANWAKRNLVKFSDLTPAQVRLAQQATTLGELELLLLDPPVAEGARLGLVLATQLPGKITLIHSGTQAKLTPASSPAAYADLTFTALTPCRIYDSRPSQGGLGTWLAGSTNTINVGPNPSYAFQGGSATSCGMDTLIGPGRIAAVMASVSTVNQASAGYLAFFSSGATNPFPYGVTQSYQPGPVQTSFVVIPTDLVGAVLASGYSTQQTNVIIDVVGYFAPPGNIALAHSTAATGNILKGGNRFMHNYGTANTFIGEDAGNLSMTGGSNTACGAFALQSNTTGNDNTACGGAALFSNTTGSFNVASGVTALFSNTTGSFNVASGLGALYSNTTGNDNIALGSGAGSDLTTGDNNIAIGNLGIAAESNTIRIGNAGNHTRAFIAGIRGVTTDVADGIAVLVDGAGQLGTVSSSRRFKDDIADMDAASSALMKLRPVTFHYKSDRAATGRRLRYGLIAEEVAEVYPGLVAHSADGQIETVMYQYLPSMMLNEYQKQQRTIDAQAMHIATLEQDRRVHAAEIAGLKSAVARIADLERQMNHMARLLDQQRAGALTAGLGLK